MKIEIIDEKIVLYLYNYFFKSLDRDNITKEIKDIFIRLIKYYKLKINGIYEVLVYENKSYGTILEIVKLEELLFHPDLIDIKVKIFKDINIYLKTNNYFILDKFKDIYYKDNNYYIDIKNINNIINIIEFIDIIYNEKDNYLDNMLLIK
ncbi:MAG: hypothetical protein IJ501_01610 [Bacilli bacterium]|nr:hypothetical protein [Bacilli bacterium]